jgi:hypothetical protein
MLPDPGVQQDIQHQKFAIVRVFVAAQIGTSDVALLDG